MTESARIRARCGNLDAVCSSPGPSAVSFTHISMATESRLNNVAETGENRFNGRRHPGCQESPENRAVLGMWVKVTILIPGG